MALSIVDEGTLITDLTVEQPNGGIWTKSFNMRNSVSSNDKSFSVTNDNYTLTIESGANIWFSAAMQSSETRPFEKYGSSIYFFSDEPVTFNVNWSDGDVNTIRLGTLTFKWKNHVLYGSSIDYISLGLGSNRAIAPAVRFIENEYTADTGEQVTRIDILGAMAMYAFYPDEFEEQDPYDAGSSGGTTGGGGGINTPDLGGEAVGVPALPSVSVTDSGFVSLYTGSEGQIKALADYLWTDLLNVSEVVEALKRLVADPMKLIIGMSIVPSQGLNVGASVPVKVGFFNTGLNLTRLASQFFTVDCGTIKFNTVCGNTFLDYSPYAKFSIYLPFIGTRSVDANDFVNHTIGVKYNCDALTGNCTCYVTKDGSVMYQFSGSLSVNCPLSSQDFTSTIISAVQMAAAGVGIVASGGTATAGLLASASAGASQIANNPSMLSPNVAHSGAVSGCAGLLGVLKPYVIREAPTYQSTKNFNTEAGYPSNIYIQLGECAGYTEIQDIHLSGINCTEGELSEIESLLKAGVIL